MPNRFISKKIFICLFGLLTVCCLLFALVWQSEQNKNLKIIFFDIGQGDSIYIRTPSQQDILIDGGSDSGVLAKLGRAMPFYDHTIDLMVLTHAHADHVAGLVEVLKRYKVRKVLYSGVEDSAPEFLEWERLINEKGVEMTIAKAGQEFIFDQAGMKVLYPTEDLRQNKFDDLNETSIVTQLVYQNTSFLFTGDAPVKVEKGLLEFYQQLGSGVLNIAEASPPALLTPASTSSIRSRAGRNAKRAGASAYPLEGAPANPLKSDVLKVGHHGSKYSSSLEFLQAVDPQYAVIQVGKDNKFGHPHEQVVKRLNGLGFNVLRNDLEGDITMESDGDNILLTDKNDSVNIIR
ncbi:MAG: ComEC/Rec2 family competence protein [Patescibacteria group bacterium]|jgi:competence protein ComEC